MKLMHTSVQPPSGFENVLCCSKFKLRDCVPQQCSAAALFSGASLLLFCLSRAELQLSSAAPPSAALTPPHAAAS
jgi:hypothetical protein